MFFIQSGEKNECFKEVSSLRIALERPKGESDLYAVSATIDGNEYDFVVNFNSIADASKAGHKYASDFCTIQFLEDVYRSNPDCRKSKSRSSWLSLCRRPCLTGGEHCLQPALSIFSQTSIASYFSIRRRDSGIGQSGGRR